MENNHQGTADGILNSENTEVVEVTNRLHIVQKSSGLALWYKNGNREIVANLNCLPIFNRFCHPYPMNGLHVSNFLMIIKISLCFSKKGSAMVKCIYI